MRLRECQRSFPEEWIMCGPCLTCLHGVFVVTFFSSCDLCEVVYPERLQMVPKSLENAKNRVCVQWFA